MKYVFQWIIVATAFLAAGAFSSEKSNPWTEAGQEKTISAADTAEESDAPAITADRFQKLIGRWERPDGGYVLDIQSVDPDGKLEAAYFNPRPIHVSQATATRKDSEIHVFIELRDAGYPGATYDLTYNTQYDALAGVYYQPAVAQQFQVVFVRKK